MKVHRLVLTLAACALAACVADTGTPPHTAEGPGGGKGDGDSAEGRAVPFMELFWDQRAWSYEVEETVTHLGSEGSNPEITSSSMTCRVADLGDTEWGASPVCAEEEGWHTFHADIRCDSESESSFGDFPSDEYVAHLRGAEMIPATSLGEEETGEVESYEAALYLGRSLDQLLMPLRPREEDVVLDEQSGASRRIWREEDETLGLPRWCVKHAWGHAENEESRTLCFAEGFGLVAGSATRRDGEALVERRFERMQLDELGFARTSCVDAESSARPPYLSMFEPGASEWTFNLGSKFSHWDAENERWTSVDVGDGSMTCRSWGGAGRMLASTQISCEGDDHLTHGYEGPRGGYVAVYGSTHNGLWRFAVPAGEDQDWLPNVDLASLDPSERLMSAHPEPSRQGDDDRWREVRLEEDGTWCVERGWSGGAESEVLCFADGIGIVRGSRSSISDRDKVEHWFELAR